MNAAMIANVDPPPAPDWHAGYTEIMNGFSVTNEWRQNDTVAAGLSWDATTGMVDLVGAGNTYRITQLATISTGVTFRGHWTAEIDDDQLFDFLGTGHVWYVEGSHQVVRVIGQAVVTNLYGNSVYGNNYAGEVTQYEAVGEAIVINDPSQVTQFTAMITAFRGPQTVTAKPKAAPARAWGTFSDLKEQLGMTQEELADAVGVGRTTPYQWQRGREPQPRHGRRLYELAATVGALRRRLDHDAFQAWLASGDPPPRELLAAGDLATVNRLADEIIFPTTRRTEGIGAVSLSDPSAGAVPRRRAAAPRSASVRTRRRER
jgi:transcriptional regulator with XRE-family HTH domain